MKRPGNEKTSEKLNLGVAMEDLAGKMKNSDLNNWFIFGSIALVLVIGLFALFHPAEQNARRGNPACGKIVVGAGLRRPQLLGPPCAMPCNPSEWPMVGMLRRGTPGRELRHATFSSKVIKEMMLLTRSSSSSLGF